MSRKATANGSSAATASRTAATAASAPSQNTGANVVFGEDSFLTTWSAAGFVNRRSRRLRNTAVSPFMSVSVKMSR